MFDDEKERLNTITELLKDFPALLTTADLVKIGIFRIIDQSYLARLRGDSPDYIKMKRKILYPKNGVIKFLEKRLQRGDQKNV